MTSHDQYIFIFWSELDTYQLLGSRIEEHEAPCYVLVDAAFWLVSAPRSTSLVSSIAFANIFQRYASYIHMIRERAGGGGRREWVKAPVDGDGFAFGWQFVPYDHVRSGSDVVLMSIGARPICETSGGIMSLEAVFSGPACPYPEYKARLFAELYPSCNFEVLVMIQCCLGEPCFLRPMGHPRTSRWMDTAMHDMPWAA